MGIIDKIFNKKEEEKKVGGMEDFMTLIRVYFQAIMASELNITNLNALPDLRIFKTTLRIPTQGGKLGIGEKARCKKMLKELYEMDDQFFKEIDQSIHRRCRKIQEVQTYMLQFQNFVQDVMMLVTNLMKYKLRLPSIFKKTIHSMVASTVNDIFNKNDFKDASVIKTVIDVREYNKKLGFSEKWVTDFTFCVVMLAKKEKPAEDQTAKNK
ncbi:MAG: hypothetical protein II826_06285 [Prevotella sp.]|nr:hypothetical protein [Prevotella sp.]MBR6320450.1 hypothetical protein [Prevotella sp.]